MDPHACGSAAALPQRGSNSRLGAVTRAADEGPRVAGIGGECKSSREADTHGDESRRGSNEAEARRREVDPAKQRSIKPPTGTSNRRGAVSFAMHRPDP